jgi:hypothetical protein
VRTTNLICLTRVSLSVAHWYISRKREHATCIVCMHHCHGRVTAAQKHTVVCTQSVRVAIKSQMYQHQSVITDSEGAAANVTAGNPLLIPANEPITLCARSDLDPNRFYAGAIANLAIYNTHLTAAQIATIYRQVNAAAASMCCTSSCCCIWLLHLHPLQQYTRSSI